MARPSPRSRPGFTLIELMIVIVVIGILVALIVPAVLAAVRTAQDAATIAEINVLGNSLASFKDKYGSYPPSRIMLNETAGFAGFNQIPAATAVVRPAQVTTGFWIGTGPVTGTDDGSDITVGQLAQRSALYMQRFFPRAAAPTATGNTVTFWHDYNGNGQPDAPGGVGLGSANWLYLEGYECLVFFLGGIASPLLNADGTVSYGMAGFGRDPVRPFTTNGDPANNVTTPAAVLSLNRYPTFFEWKNNRLGDLDNDSMLDYADYLSTGDHVPYIYFSAYDGAGYDPNDQNIVEASENTGIGPISRLFSVNLGISPLITTHFTAVAANVIESCAPNPYTSSTPIPGSGQKIATFINANTFQILSPGRDREYGVGGQYDPNANQRLPDDGWMFPGPNSTAATVDGSLRIRERDNLSNFAPSKLD